MQKTITVNKLSMHVVYVIPSKSAGEYYKKFAMVAACISMGVQANSITYTGVEKKLTFISSLLFSFFYKMGHFVKT